MAGRDLFAEQGITPQVRQPRDLFAEQGIKPKGRDLFAELGIMQRQSPAPTLEELGIVTTSQVDPWDLNTRGTMPGSRTVIPPEEPPPPPLEQILSPRRDLPREDLTTRSTMPGPEIEFPTAPEAKLKTPAMEDTTTHSTLANPEQETPRTYKGQREHILGQLRMGREVDDIVNDFMGVQQPMIDPFMVGPAAAGSTGRMLMLRGAKKLPALSRALLSGGVAATADLPIGMATEGLAERYPKLAVPFLISVGLLSGATLEPMVERRLTAIATKLVKSPKWGMLKPGQQHAVAQEVVEGLMKDPLATIDKLMPGGYVDEFRDAFSRNPDLFQGMKQVAPTQVPKPGKVVSRQMSTVDNFSDMVTDAVKTTPRAEPEADVVRLEPLTAKKSQMVEDLKDSFDTAIRIGKFRSKGGDSSKTLGIYNRRTQVIRTEKANDIPTLVHEIGHHMHDLKDALKIPDKMPKEVRAMAYEGAMNLDREGFAEFVRLYVTEPETVQKLAPGFTKGFEVRLAQAPEIRDVLTKARESWKLWNAQDHVQKVASFIRAGADESKKSLTFNEIYRHVKDHLHPFRVARDRAEQKGATFQPKEDPYLLARLTKGWARKAHQWLKYGTFQYDDAAGVKFTGPPLGEMLEPVEKAGQRHLLDTYLFARRAESDPRILEGFDRILDPEDIRKTAEDLAPQFEELAQKLQNYSDQLLDYLVDSQRIGPGLAQRIRDANPFYAPIYRVMDEGVERGKGLSSKAFSDIGSPVKRLGSSSRDIHSPTESLIYNTYAMINAAERNRVGVALARLSRLPGMGSIVERVPVRLKPVQMTTDEAVGGMAKKMGMSKKELLAMFPPEMDEGILGEMLTTFRPQWKAGPNEAIFYINGRPQLFELDPFLAKGVQGLDGSHLDLITSIFAMPAKVLRAGATTFSPSFAARNPVRDQWIAFIQSKYGFSPLNTMRGIFHMVKQDEAWQAYNASGAAHAALVSMDRNYIAKSVKELFGDASLKKVAKNPLQAMQMLSEAGEEMTRVGEFAKIFSKEGGDLNALFSGGVGARDISIDFSRVGGKGAKAINSISAFWNARLEGMDRMGRAFKDHPYKTSAKVFASVTLPSLIEYAAFHDDPYWQELPTWRKNLMWNIPIYNDDGSLKTILSIPKPFEYGQIFGSLPVAALQWLKDNDRRAFTDVILKLQQTLNIIPVPTGLVPIAENMAGPGGWDYFFDTPVVPRGKETLPPYLQYGHHTSETAKFTARLMKEVPGLARLGSPAKIENLIQGYFAALGDLGLETGDWLLKTANLTDVPNPPSKTISDIPMLGAFFTRYPAASSASIEQFYAQYKDLSQAHEERRELAGIRGKTELLGVNMPKPPELKQYEKVAGVMDTLRDTLDFVRRAEDLTGDQKKERMDNIYNAMINIARVTTGKEPMPDTQK